MKRILSITVATAFLSLACGIDEPQVSVRVRDSKTGPWHEAKIDRCIAPIVAALQSNGIITVTSCCGHNSSSNGYIVLQDRILYVGKVKDSKALADEFDRNCIGLAVNSYTERDRKDAK